MSGDIRPFKSRADNFLDQLIASALQAKPTPETCLICALASLRTALKALRAEPPDASAARMYAQDATAQIGKAGL